MNITASDSIGQSPQSSPHNDKSKAADFARLKKACEQFESLFIYYMLKTMRSASEKSSLFGEGLGAGIFTQLFDEGLAEKMAESGPFGIGDSLMKSYARIAGLSEEDYKTYDTINTRPVSVRPNIKTRTKTLPAVGEASETNGYDHIVEEAARKHGVSPELVKAVISRESGGNPRAISARGAKGLMQLMDGTAGMLGVTDPFNIRQNIFGGVKYLSSLINKFGGDLKKALAAYNAGPGAVEKYGGVPPFEETKNYVADILGSLGDSFNLSKSR